MAGLPEDMAREQEYLGALTSTVRFHMTANHLELFGDHDEVLAKFQRRQRMINE